MRESRYFVSLTLNIKALRMAESLTSENLY